MDDTVGDVRAIKELDLRGGALLPGRPDDSEVPPLYDPAYEPLWSVCEELDVPVTHHSGQGSPDYGKTGAAGAMGRRQGQWVSPRPLLPASLGGVFQRHPH